MIVFRATTLLKQSGVLYGLPPAVAIVRRRGPSGGQGGEEAEARSSLRASRSKSKSI